MSAPTCPTCGRTQEQHAYQREFGLPSPCRDAFHSPMTDKSEPAPSRSIARRLAAQKGEPVPEFTQQAPGQSAKSRQESRQSVGTAEEALREAHQQIGLLLKAFRDGHRDAMETVFLHAAIDAAVAAARREGHAQNCVCGTQFTSYFQEATRSVLDPRCLAFWEGKS